MDSQPEDREVAENRNFRLCRRVYEGWWDSALPASALQMHLFLFHLCLQMAQGADAVTVPRKKHALVD